MNNDAINFLRDSLSHHYNLRNGLDHKASFVVGVAGIMFGLSLAHLEESYFMVLAATSFVTALLAVWGVFLPFRRRGKNDFGLMCWWGFRQRDFNEYKAELEKVFVSPERIAGEYQKEIWNLVKYSIKPKTRLLEWASLVLIFGVLASFILFVINY